MPFITQAPITGTLCYDSLIRQVNREFPGKFSTHALKQLHNFLTETNQMHLLNSVYELLKDWEELPYKEAYKKYANAEITSCCGRANYDFCISCIEQMCQQLRKNHIVCVVPQQRTFLICKGTENNTSNN